MTWARRLTASDGVEIALHRMRAHRDGRPAVLLVHGAFSGNTVWLRNGRARDTGLAYFLGARGFDVWLADLRGHGLSAREPARFRWRFEDWILKDTPTLVARVVEETGGAPLVWIGHSSGGAVGLCWLARLSGAALPLAACVTLGTPGPLRMGAVRRGAAWSIVRLTRLLGRFPSRALRFGPEDESAGVLGQWMGWNVAGSWRGDDGFDYWSGLARVRVPHLSVAGAGDWLFAPPAACQQVVDAVGAARKELFVTAPGIDHRGLLLDARAPQDYWPRMATWLDETLGTR
jgi:predicted alpha/beta hydrolase